MATNNNNTTSEITLNLCDTDITIRQTEARRKREGSLENGIKRYKTMPDYKPTYKDRCEYPTCKAYGKPCVDRGYGYPVCESNKWRHELYPGTEDKPMHPRYLEAI